MAVFIFILGIIAFLLMGHMIVFWCVFVPLAILFIASLLTFFKSPGTGVRHFITAMITLAVMVVALLIVCIP